MPKLDIKELKRAVPDLRIAWDDAARALAGSDHTENLSFPPEVVVWPMSTEQVSGVLRWASKAGVHVTPAGALTGLSGGALPVRGGVAMNFGVVGDTSLALFGGRTRLYAYNESRDC